MNLNLPPSLPNMARRGCDIEVFFDGDCPLCRREIGLLQRWDRHHRIRFTDLAAMDFDATRLDIPFERLVAEIHARLPDGRWLRGVEVFRRLWSRAGPVSRNCWKWATACSRATA